MAGLSTGGDGSSGGSGGAGGSGLAWQRDNSPCRLTLSAGLASNVRANLARDL